MKKIVNGIYVALGCISIILGVLGIVLPILPTTPFLLLAAALFAKGSQRFYQWFTGTKLYKKYIEDTMKKKEMTIKKKISVLTPISLLLLIGFVMSPVWYAKAIIIVVAVFHGYYFLFRVKTIEEEELDFPEECED